MYGNNPATSTIYEISKITGIATITSFIDNQYRGLYLLNHDKSISNKCNLITDCPIICTIGVTFSTGEINLQELYSGSTINLFTTNDNFQGITRDATNNIFYIVNNQNGIWSYNPCINNGNNPPIFEGTITGSISSIRAIAYNEFNGLLYVINNIFGTGEDELWSVDLSSFSGTFIGNTGQTSIQSAEFDQTGILYAWTQPQGLITISINDATVTFIPSTSLPPNMIIIYCMEVLQI